MVEGEGMEDDLAWSFVAGALQGKRQWHRPKRSGAVCVAGATPQGVSGCKWPLPCAVRAIEGSDSNTWAHYAIPIHERPLHALLGFAPAK